MSTPVQGPGMRRRRTHTAELKARLVAASQEPGASIAGIALANQINANPLHKWIREHRLAQGALAQPAVTAKESPPRTLVPLTLANATPSLTSDIQIEIRRQQTTVHIAWPLADAAACGQWLRALLR